MPEQKTSHWVVRECTTCGLLWPDTIALCHYCAGYVGPPFDVVRSVGARGSDPDTSKLAALRQQPRSGSQRARILEYLRTAGPASSREIEQALAISGAWKRVSELRQGGHITELATKYDNETRTMVTVYALQHEPSGALF